MLCNSFGEAPFYKLVSGSRVDTSGEDAVIFAKDEWTEERKTYDRDRRKWKRDTPEPLDLSILIRRIYPPTYLYSYLLPLCGSFIVKVFSSLLLFFSFACVHALFRSSFSSLPRGPARPIRRSSSPLTRGYLTLIQPWNVRTARHVIYPPIVNFPNIITSLGIIRIPSGLVIVERRLGRGSLLASRCFRFSASMMQTVRKIRTGVRIVSYVIDLSHRVDIPDDICHGAVCGVRKHSLV